MKFTFLSSTDSSFNAVWNWAKKLVTDLNKLAATVGGSSGGSVTGAIATWITADIPDGWLICNGSIISKNAYPELFALIQHTYGGAGDSFRLPDFRNRLLMGAGSLVALGVTAGASSVGISVANMPSHDHGITDPGHTHAFTGANHQHAITDPGHVHGVTDPGHVHAEGTDTVATGYTAGAAGGPSVGNTASANTGISVNSSVTGIANTDFASATGVVSPDTTDITIQASGGGNPLNILNPVVGVHIIIKT